MSPEQLFPRPAREFLTLLAGLPKHLDAAMPMRRQHRRELPGDIRHLSHLLTDERGDLRRDYLADPAALSAYLRYFLPWNIYRLGILFNGLAIDPGGDNADGAATIIDLGTGPLTAPLTLWMSRPHLRKRPLHFICVDRAPKPMRLGLDALHSLAAAQGGLGPWKVTLVKSPLDARLREKADLLIMANALNEVLHRGEGEDLLESAEALAWHLSGMLTPTGSVCVVEPGIRPSAHLMAALRRGFLHHGLSPIAPCPHTGPCPMSGRGFTAWCHFNFDAEAAPNWLKKLSDEARLPKDNVSLGFLHFSAKGRKLEAAPGKTFVRAVSGPFELPEDMGATRRFGQYACSEHGLTLLSLARKHLVPAPGALLEAAWPEAPATDIKSGALVLPLGGDHAPAPRPTPAKPAPRTPNRNADAKPAAKPEAKPHDRPTKSSGYPKQPNPAKQPGATKGTGAKAPDTLTVDSLLAEETPAPPRRKRLPSERPMEEKRAPRKPAGKPAGKPSGKPSGKSSGKPAGGKSADSRAARKSGDGMSAGGKSGQKPGRKPAPKTGKKPRGPKES